MATAHKPGVLVDHHWQRPGLCGPSALKMQLSSIGLTVSDRRIALLAGATSSEGTEHEGLIQAARHLGVYTYQKRGASLKDIEYFIHEERLPVLVGWFSTTVDHYAVATNITKKRILLADPGVPPGPPRRMLRSHFDAVWFDFSGKESRHVVRRWLMVVSPERRRFEIEGGRYHLPVRTPK